MELLDWVPQHLYKKGCENAMEIVIIDKKVDREYLIKEYYTILDGTLLGKGFLKRNELYYRIYGDGFLQTVYPYSGPKGIEVRLYIDCIPLYQWMDVLNSKIVISQII